MDENKYLKKLAHMLKCDLNPESVFSSDKTEHQFA